MLREEINQYCPDLQPIIRQYGYCPVYGPHVEDRNFARGLFYHLEKRYPGWQWKIQVMDSVVKIINEDLSHDWGYTGFINQFDSDGKVVAQIGGEFLERFGLPPLGQKKVIEIMETLTRDKRGNITLCQ